MSQERPAPTASAENGKPARPRASVAVVLLAVIGVACTMYFARVVLFPIVLALLIAFALRAPVRWLGRMWIPSFVGAVIVVGTVLTIVVGGVFMLARPAATWIADAPSQLREVEHRLRDVRRSVAEISQASKKVEEMTETVRDPSTVKVEVEQPSLTSTAFNATSGFLLGATITLSLVFLLLAFGEQYLDAVVDLLPTHGDERNVRQMCLRIEQTISHYLLAYTAINAGLGFVIGIGLWLIGLPNPILWGVMAACLNYIPFVGLFIGTVVVALAGVFSFDSPAYAMLAPAIYLAANGIEANIVTPSILGRSMSLNVIVIFISIVVWGWMWGIGGALIAVPLLSVAKIICDHFESLRPIACLLAAPGSPCGHKSSLLLGT